MRDRGRRRVLLSFAVLVTAAVAARFSVSATPQTATVANQPQTASQPGEDKLAVFSTVANYSVPVISRNGEMYAGLLEILDPLGRVSAKTDKNRWKLNFNDFNAEFTANKDKVKMRGGDTSLSAPFLLENSRGLVPLSSISALLPRILGGPVSYHEASRRLFIGAMGIHFTASVQGGAPPVLQMRFTSRVNPAMNQEGDELRLVFHNDPLLPPSSPLLTFGNSAIPSASYSENNGEVELTVTGTSPLVGKLSDDGLTLTITPVVQAAVPHPAAPIQPAGAPASTGRRFFAVIDASHGGTDPGALLTASLAEKEVTLALALRIRQEFTSRGLATLLVRDGDRFMPTDLRAGIANAAQPAIYICVHASSAGKGVRVIRSNAAGAETKAALVDWDTVQVPFEPLSAAAAAAVESQLQRNKLTAHKLYSDLAPLNNINSAAIAIEFAPLNRPEDLSDLSYQQAVAYGVVAGIDSIRQRLEAAR